MWTICLFAFLVCLIINMVKNGEALAILTQFVSYANSFKEASPRRATEKTNFLEVEYKYGKRIFCITIPRKKMQVWNDWSDVAVMKNGTWVVKTGKIYYYAGPFKNFHGFAVMPKHISEKYEKLAFKLKIGGVIHVLPNEVITEKLKATYEKYVQEAEEQLTKHQLTKEHINTPAIPTSGPLKAKNAVYPKIATPHKK